MNASPRPGQRLPQEGLDLAPHAGTAGAGYRILTCGAPAALLLALPFSHVTAPRILLLLLTLLGAIWVWRRERPALPMLPALAVWVLAALLSLADAVDPSYSLNEVKKEVGFGVITFLSFFVLSRGERRFALLRRLIMGGFFAVAGVYVFEVHRYGIIESGYAGGVGLYSTYLLLAMPWLVLGFYREGRARRLWPLWLITAALFIYSGYLTLNLMLWPALLVEIGVLALAWPLRRRKLILGTTAALAALLALGFAGSAVQKGRMQEISLQEFARPLQSDPRPFLWKQALQLLEAHPVNGVGFGRDSYGKALPEVVAGNGLFWHSHNLALNYAVQMGIPGILALMAVMGTLGWRLFALRRGRTAWDRALAAAGLALLAGMLAKNMTDDFLIRHMGLFFWACMGSLLGYGSYRRGKPAEPGVGSGSGE